MTIAVVSWASGPHVRFIDRWLASIRALDRQPEQIILGTDTDMRFDGVDVLWCPKQRFEPRLLNAAVRASDTEWVCKLDVDDVIFPHAFDRVDEWSSDVTVFGVKVAGSAWQPRADDLLTSPSNACTSASPFRRHVWHAGKFADLPYWDWAFWIQAAKNGFTFEPSGTVDYEYGIHPDQVSVRELHDERTARVLAWRSTL